MVSLAVLVEALGILVAGGGGGLLYLTLSDLLPEAQERHYQQSAALAGGLGFALIVIIASIARGA